MANTTLAMMQAIEAEAQEILDGYEQKISNLKTIAQVDLDSLAKRYDEETENEVATLKVQNAADLVALRDRIAMTIAQNEAAVREALTDKKADLVTAIVEKVVARYGH